MKRGEAIGGMVLLLFGMVTIILALRMPIGTFRMAGTGLFPLCLGIILMILSGGFILKVFFQSNKGKDKSVSSVESPGLPMVLILFLGTMVFIALFFDKLGYPLASFILMVALLRILGVKKWARNLPLSLVTAIACYFLFVQWLKIPLPKGWLGI